MPTPKKAGTYFNMKMEQELYDRMTAYCSSTGVPKTTVVEKALKAYLDEAETDQRMLTRIKEGGTSDGG